MEIVEDGDSLEIESRMRTGLRVVIGLIGLFPFIAPYELLIKPRWTGYLNLFFAFALIVSLGAITVSLFFIAAALIGLDSRTRFDRARRLVWFTNRAPLIPATTRGYSFDAVRAIEVKTHEWSDGPPSYTVEILTDDGRSFSAGSSWDRTEAEEIAARAAAFIKGPSK